MVGNHWPTEAEILSGMVDCYVRDKDNFGKLEHIVAESQRKYLELGPLRNINFLAEHPDNMLSEDDLKRQFSRVSWSINRWLGVTGVPAPRIKYLEKSPYALPSIAQAGAEMASSAVFGLVSASLMYLSVKLYQTDAILLAGIAVPAAFNAANNCIGSAKDALPRIRQFRKEREFVHYAPPVKTIFTRSFRKEHLIPILAHEAGHHVQNALDFHQGVVALQEGHARGVQRMISEKYAYEKDNTRYLVGIRQLDYAEHKIAYRYACMKRGRDPNLLLMYPISPRDAAEQRAFQEQGLPSEHALGNSFYAMLELSSGSSIYESAIKNGFKVEKFT